MAGRTILSIFDEGTSKGNSLLGDSVFSSANKSDGVSKDGLDSILKEINASFNGFFQQQRDLKTDSDSSSSESSSSSVSTETYAESVTNSNSSGSSETKSDESYSSASEIVQTDATAAQFDAKDLIDSIGITASDSFTKMLNEENKQSAEIAKSTNVENKTSSSVDDGLKTLYSKIDAMDSAIAKNAENANSSVESTVKTTSDEASSSEVGWFSGLSSMIGSKIDSLFGNGDKSEAEEASNVETEEVSVESTPLATSNEGIAEASVENPNAVSSNAEAVGISVESTPLASSNGESEEGGGWLSGLTSMVGSKIGSLFGGGDAEKADSVAETKPASEEKEDEGGWLSGLTSMVGSKIGSLFGGGDENGGESATEPATESAEKEDDGGGWLSGLTSMVSSKIDSLFGGGDDSSQQEAVGAVDEMISVEKSDGETVGLTTDAVAEVPFGQFNGQSASETPTVLKGESLVAETATPSEGRSVGTDMTSKIEEMKNAIVSSISSLAETQKTTSDAILNAIGGIGANTAVASESQTVVVSQQNAAPPTAPRTGRIGI